MNNLEQTLENKEVLEPETLRGMDPKMTDKERQLLQVKHLLLHSQAPYLDMDVFENVVLVLNGISTDIGKREGSTPELVWKAIDKIRQIYPEFKLSHEVKMYIKYIFNDHGYMFYPPNIGIEPNKDYEQVKSLAEKGPFPLNDDYLGIQAMRYLKIREYLV